MSIEDYLTHTLKQLETIYSAMDSAAGPVMFRDIGPHRQFRHGALTESLACYLKGVRAISSLNACVLLLRAGYTQEVGALCRMVDDFCNEIFFLLVPQADGNFSEDQIKFLENFYKEEFERPEDPLGSAQKRNTVPTKKIFATFGKLAESELNPSDAQEALRTVHQAFSGYVHGAYPHIMELYGGNPPHFHVSGMLNTPRIDEWRNQLVGYVHRLIISSVFISRKMGVQELEPNIRKLLDVYEAEMKLEPTLTAKEILDNYKKKSRL